MADPGFEIYAGKLQDIKTACMDDDLFEKLRNGTVTKHYVHFHSLVNPGDILYLDSALGKMRETPIKMDIEREELDNGVFVDYLNSEWVNAVATLSEIKSSDLQAKWIECFYETEGELPKWSSIDQTETLQKLIEVCQFAVKEKVNLAMVWML